MPSKTSKPTSKPTAAIEHPEAPGGMKDHCPTCGFHFVAGPQYRCRVPAACAKRAAVRLVAFAQATGVAGPTVAEHAVKPRWK